MAFVKGAWVELDYDDSLWYDYYCCPHVNTLIYNYPADPRIRPYYSCGCNGQTICNAEDLSHRENVERRIIKPDWCPLPYTRDFRGKFEIIGGIGEITSINESGMSVKFDGGTISGKPYK